ncbi:MAG: oxidoreductase [Alcaligenaceae bacterium]|nr:oxidoreductase [Alcaligenaceae bacterium]
MKAILVRNTEEGYSTALTEVSESELPEGDVAVDVVWSTLNYKDALAVTGRGKVIRSFPMVPGIDFAGVVTESRHPDYKPGDEVVMTGWGMGETRWGGFAARARVFGDMLVKLPPPLSLRDSMVIGTAGLTSMLCVLALERQGVKPDRGPVLVTGATGGVGSIAVKILAGRGYDVVASTGKSSEQAYLHELGAKEIIDRNELSAPGKPLEKERWAAAIDTVGGNTLANVCASTRYLGIVAACGLVESIKFPATVAPFILRGVTLVGIDSGQCPLPLREQAWSALASELPRDFFQLIAREVSLDEVSGVSEEILAGTVRGRLLVRVT